jgi:hypothetical protein
MKTSNGPTRLKRRSEVGSLEAVIATGSPPQEHCSPGSRPKPRPRRPRQPPDHRRGPCRPRPAKSAPRSRTGSSSERSRHLKRAQDPPMGLQIEHSPRYQRVHRTNETIQPTRKRTLDNRRHELDLRQLHSTDSNHAQMSSWREHLRVISLCICKDSFISFQ